jgi:hypothetical protein
VRRQALDVDRDPLAALTGGDHAVARTPALHAQDGVEVPQACDPVERTLTQLFVGDRQVLDQPEAVGVGGEGAHDVRADHEPSLHVRYAGAARHVTVDRERPLGGGAGREHGVVMAEQRDARRPGALQRGAQIAAGELGARAIVPQPRRHQRRELIQGLRVAAGAVVRDPRLQIGERERKIVARAAVDLAGQHAGSDHSDHETILSISVKSVKDDASQSDD